MGAPAAGIRADTAERCLWFEASTFTKRQALLTRWGWLMRAASTGLTGGLLAFALVLAGCGRADRSAGEDAAGWVVRTVEDGPAMVTLAVRPGEPQAGERVQVRVRASSDSGVPLDVDDYERRLRGEVCRFDCRVIRADRNPVREVTAGRTTRTWNYEIEFLVAGELELPAVGARYSVVLEKPNGAPSVAVASGVAEPKLLLTEPLALTVRAAPGAELSAAELRQLTTLDPVEMPRRWSRWWWLGPLLTLAGATVLLLAAYLVSLVFPPLRRWLRRLWAACFSARAVAAVPPPPAHEWASAELARLLREDLMGRGRVQEFFYRISDIIRGYLERRFFVSAPDMTTEEFLAAAAQDRRFGRDHTLALERFLTACDLVKYARLLPERDQADELVAAARRFIEATRERPAERLAGHGERQERAA